jgi:peptide subunit release factor 1 (eRF1)
VFSDADLKDLVSFISPAPVLSLYMHTDPSERNAETFKLRLRNILKGIDLLKDVEEVERFFNHEYDWTGRGVAVFSSEPQQFWRVYTLALPVPDRVVVSNRPSIKPLTNLMETYGGYGVVLADQQHARFFLFHLGELTEGAGVTGEEVKHTKLGGASSVAGMRGGMAGQTQYSSETISRNMKEAAEKASIYFQENHVRRILLGGTPDNLTQFRSFLPKYIQSLVQGTITVAVNANFSELQEKIPQMCRESEQKKETKLLNDFLTSAAKGNNAVTGLKETLEMVNAGRVRTLITLAGFQVSALHCTQCGLLTTQALERCPNCNIRFEQVPDAIDHAMHEVLRKGGEVETIASSPELEKAGSIGALLRY